MIKKYSIADFNISVDIEQDEYFIDALQPYANDFAKEADLAFKLTRTTRSIKPSYTDLARIGEDKYYCRVDGEDALINFDPSTGKIIALTRFSHDYKTVDILSYDITADHNYSVSRFNFNLVGNAMHYVAAMHSGFVFHSSSIVTPGGAVAFSAKSGTGKSTHTSLWLNEFDDVSILNDDTPIMRLDKDGNVFLYGTPWAGTTGINQNKKAPLRAIVFLERSRTNEMSAISSAEAIKLFFTSVIPPLSASMHIRYLDTLKSIFVAVPIYKLKCNMDPDAAHCSRDYIFKNTK